jgi:hypothetical protein
MAGWFDSARRGERGHASKWAMMIIGFLGLSLIAYQRKNAVRFV